MNDQMKNHIMCCCCFFAMIIKVQNKYHLYVRTELEKKSPIKTNTRFSKKQ